MGCWYRCQGAHGVSSQHGQGCAHQHGAISAYSIIAGRSNSAQSPPSCPLLEVSSLTTFTYLRNMNTESQPSIATARASLNVLTEWTMQSSTTYALTIVILFTMGLFGRFLGAVKAQLERSWETSHKVINKEQEAFIDLQNDESSEFQPLSSDMEFVPPKSRRHLRSSWVTDEARNVKHDGVRALLEFFRAIIAYIL